VRGDKTKVVFAHIEYLGGHPSRPEPKSTAEGRGQLIVDDFGIRMRSLSGAMPGFKEFFMVPWSEVIEVVVEGSNDTAQLSVSTRSYTCGFKIHKTEADEVRSLLARWTEWLPAPVAPAVEVPPPAPTLSVSDELAKLESPQDQGV
jgi:hypothetical protein